jgi:hypothetical protein
MIVIGTELFAVIVPLLAPFGVKVAGRLANFSVAGLIVTVPEADTLTGAGFGAPKPGAEYI